MTGLDEVHRLSLEEADFEVRVYSNGSVEIAFSLGGEDRVTMSEDEFLAAVKWHGKVTA